MICTGCIHNLPRTNFHVQISNPVFKRINGRLPLQFAVSYLLFRKGGSVQHLLHEFKYNNHPEIGRVLGRVYGAELAQSGYADKLDVIVPVPLHNWKKRKRGYNQSEEFAIGLSEGLNVPHCNDAVQRIVNTQTQTRKSKLKRWENVTDVFKVTDCKAVASKRILLVDDVITTGATLEACGLAVLAAGCSAVSVASIAYAVE